MLVMVSGKAARMGRASKCVVTQTFPFADVLSFYTLILNRLVELGKNQIFAGCLPAQSYCVVSKSLRGAQLLMRL